MNRFEFNRTQVVKYLLWTFAIAWIIQVGVAVLYRNGNTAIGGLIMAAMMYVPTLGVLLSGGKLREMGWKPQIRRNWREILFAWFGPAILTAIGAALYFLIFPGHLDLSGAYLVKMGGESLLAQLEAQGLTYPMYILSNIAACVTYAPPINMIAALGEEIGWRGFLYPQLKGRFGKEKGRILGSVIWGMWHWPVIWLIGYEYGMEYFGFPVVGMVLFCGMLIPLGIICDWLYERSKSIWLPSLCHGTINAAATVPMVMCIPGTGSARLLGPAPNGIISVIPFLIVAALISVHGKERD